MSKLLREKLEYLSVRFTTGEGVFEFFISNFIWGFITVKFSVGMFELLRGIFDFVSVNWLRDYLSYTVFGVFTMFLGLFITWVIVEVFALIKGR